MQDIKTNPIKPDLSLRLRRTCILSTISIGNTAAPHRNIKKQLMDGFAVKIENVNRAARVNRGRLEQAWRQTTVQLVYALRNM